MKDVHVILRAYEGEKQPHANRPRGMSKKQTMRRCVASLGQSIRSQSINYLTRVSVVADRVSPSMLEYIDEALCPNLVCEGEYGNADSLREAFELAARTHTDQLARNVYLVEDDYVHAPWAIPEIVDVLYDAGDKHSFGWIHPTDYPDFYTRDAGIPAEISLGYRVHWRTCRTTTFTFGGPAEAFADLESELMETCHGANDGKLSEHLRHAGGIGCPIPTLAAHWQSNATLPSFPPATPDGRGRELNGWARYMQQFE